MTKRDDNGPFDQLCDLVVIKRAARGKWPMLRNVARASFGAVLVGDDKYAIEVRADGDVDVVGMPRSAPAGGGRT